MANNILITGITGFVGSHLCDYILNNHKEVKIYGTKRYHLSRLEHVKHFYSRVNWIDCDITDSRATLELIEETINNNLLTFKSINVIVVQANYVIIQIDIIYFYYFRHVVFV